MLNALAHYDVFGGGISRYGCSDLLALADGSHKFEARSMDWLVGPLPEYEALYIDRSPITHVDKITAPMLLLQGLDDVVVPPDQSQKIVDALRSKGIPVNYLEFEGEGHGFRRSETIITALNAELAFLDSLQ